MRRRLLLLASFAGSLVACASLLGDFDVSPIADVDAGGDGGGSSSGTTTSSSGNAGDSGTDSGEAGTTPDLQPTGLQVATSTSATCATVQYSTGRKVTYCWGAQGAKYPAATVGTSAGDPNVDGFYRPRLQTSDTRFLNFSSLTGAGTGEWFVGRGTDGQTTGVYAWGSNDNGESAAGQVASTMPNQLKLGVALDFDAIYAGPAHGCLVQNQKLLCWGNNAKCEIRSGDEATCNTTDLPLLSDKISHVVEEESSHESGKAPMLRMAGGLDHSCIQAKSNDIGVDAADDIMCWGSNVFGQIDASAGTFVNKPTSVNVKVKRAGAELAAGENHTCAITGANKISCWGRNDAGQANPANKAAKTKPFEVANVPGALSTLRAAGDLSCVVSRVTGPTHALCWGNGPKARVAGEEEAPVGRIAAIQDVTDLAIGRAHGCAVAKKEGAAETDLPRVWCWGTNDFKRVDPRAATTQSFSQPVQVMFPPEPAN